MKGFEDLEREISSSLAKIRRCLTDTSRMLTSTRVVVERVKAEYELLHIELSKRSLKPAQRTNDTSAVVTRVGRIRVSVAKRNRIRRE